MEKEVRTRFAPSPTGFLHIGGIRTALFSWCLARHFNGKFILRIEDTDQTRLVPGSIRTILEDFAWFGITIDEGPSVDDLKKIGETWDGFEKLAVGGEQGPYIQSLRLPRYQEIAQKLVELGVAYRCDCTSEMLEKERNEQMARREQPGYSGYCRHRNVGPETKHVVRLKIPENRELSFVDGVKGKIVWETIALRDTVLLKSDGFPTYHLAVVVDDHDMRISHALRGEEWISTTPVHLLIYEALGWTPPVICHLPQVLGTDGKKLSKRHGSTFVANFKEQGYLPEALANFLCLIGWSPGDGEEQEIFSKEEISKLFVLDRIQGAGGVFHYNKLDWMNGMYIRNLKPDQFIQKIMPFLEKAELKIDHKKLEFIAPHVQERMKVLTEAPAMIDFLFKDKIDREMENMLKKGIDKDIAKDILNKSLERLALLSDFSVANVEEILRNLATELNIKPGPMFGVIRIAITGKMITPPLFESVVALGKDLSLLRIQETLDLLN